MNKEVISGALLLEIFPSLIKFSKEDGEKFSFGILASEIYVFPQQNELIISGFYIKEETKECYYFNSKFFDDIKKYSDLSSIKINRKKDLQSLQFKFEYKSRRIITSSLITARNLIQEIPEEELGELLNDKESKLIVRNCGSFQGIFGIKKLSDQVDFEFWIFYILKYKEKLEGIRIKLQPHMPNRNALILNFNVWKHKFLRKYNFDDKLNVLYVTNYLQDLQTELFKNSEYKIFEEYGKGPHNFSKPSYFFEDDETVIYLPKFKIKEISNFDSGANHIYLMLNRRNGYYKIGRSLNPIHREKTLQSEDPDIVLIKKWRVPVFYEKHLHKEYKNNRIRGEWFKLSDVDIVQIEIFMKDKEAAHAIND